MLYPRSLDCIPALKLAFSHLKMDGWKSTFPWGRSIFRCENVSFREGLSLKERRQTAKSASFHLPKGFLIHVWSWLGVLPRKNNSKSQQMKSNVKDFKSPTSYVWWVCLQGNSQQKHVQHCPTILSSEKQKQTENSKTICPTINISKF